MSAQIMSEVERGLERLFTGGTLSKLHDGELLERFIRHHDRSAFEALLERHGPMVRAVCRRGLADPAAADDVFQVTFITLLLRAHTVRSAHCLAGWLQKVACRAVAKSLRSEARRRRVESHAPPRASADRPDPDQIAILHDEIARLPERYRTPLVLCHLEGYSAAAVAETLRCPVGTVWVRLSRARERLRTRLARRGAAPALAMLARFPDRVSVVVPPALAARTCRLGVAALDGTRALARAATPDVVRLTHAIRSSEQVTRLGVVLSISGVLVLALGLGALARRGAGRPAAVTAMATVAPAALATKADEPREPRLPDGCDPIDRKTAPNGKSVAFVGRYTPPEPSAETRYGLFVVDVGTKNVRQLLDRGLKTTVAWSPDSRKLAIGDAAGYTNHYPLVIVDATTGALDRTGVEGAGPAWSPDGRFVAVSTGFHQGGSWSGGVPLDGRIGLYDTETRRLIPLSPEGYNLDEPRGDQSAMRGACRPLWSPDGRRLAFELWARATAGTEKTEVREVWVVDQDGKNLRRALAGSTLDAQWSADGKQLTIAASKAWPGGQVSVDTLPVLGPEGMPQPPAALLDRIRATADAERRAADFDAAPILAANRAWQKPALDHLKSVQFTHKMEPTELDERFLWRSDGAMSVEVLREGGKTSVSPVGRLRVFAPGGSTFTFAPGAKYPSVESTTADQDTAFAREHLMGTRVHFVALAWGRDPARFTVRDVRRADDGKTLTLELAYRPTREHRRFALDAGAMFDSTSWAYVHDLSVGTAELTVDNATHRIVREVDRGLDGKVICEIDLDEWADADEGRSVPLRIRFRFPGQSFTVEDHFQWHPERLWILRAGRSQFDGKAPEHETIADLAINAPTPALDEALERGQRMRDALEAAPTEKAVTRAIATGPFRLGVKLPLAGERLESLLWTFDPELDKDPSLARWDHPSLCAVVSRRHQNNGQPGVGEALLLVLYDDAGRPLGSAYAAMPAGKDTAVLDLGRARALGSAKSWSLTHLTADRAESVRPAGSAAATDAATFGIHAGRTEVVQVSAVPDGLAPGAEAGEDAARKVTRIRSATFGKADRDRLTASLEITSRDAWKELELTTTVVILDDRGVPIAAGSAAPRFRVYGETYSNSDVSVSLQGLVQSASASRTVIGAQTVVVGAPMGSLWGMFGHGDSPYSVESLLIGEEPSVWQRGLVVLGEPANVADLGRLDLDDPRSTKLDARTWGDIHRHIRPHTALLAALFPRAQEAGPHSLARLCLLAGYTGDAQLVPLLEAQLTNADGAVTDASAVGLGLLGQGAARTQLDAILARPEPTDPEARRALNLLKVHATRAIDVLGR